MAALKYNVDIVNMHIQGGSEMMKHTVTKVNELCFKNKLKRPLLIGVTLLTSLDINYLREYK